MEDSIVNEFSRKNLLGRKESSNSMQSALSLDEHVVENTPPMFIVACRDDKVVDYRNSRALYNAMLMKKAQCEFHLFDHGGHGFGVNENKAGKEAAQWKSFFINWLNTLFN
jgi:predicted esterase